MNKPFTLIIEETEKKIIEIINNSNIPAFCAKMILTDVLNQLNKFDNEEIEKYKEELKNNLEKEEIGEGDE